MKNFIFTLCLALMLLSCTSRTKEVSPTPTPTQLSVLTTGKVLENTKATETNFQLYRLLASNPENVSFSPLSFKSAFSLLYPGTEGSTKKMYERIFGFDEKSLAPPPSITKNSLWVKNPKNVLEDFKESLKAQNAELFKINVDEMNEWVQLATQNKILKSFDKSVSNQQVVAVSTLYFKQKWATPFEPKNTSYDLFRSNPSLSLKVPTLHGKQKTLYHEDDLSTWVELRYENSPVGMLFALPKKHFDLRAVEEKLSTDYLNTIISKLSEREVTLAIPKFKFERKESFKELLTNAGYGELFTKANYSQIFEGKAPVGISDVVQGTFIEVDEAGTEAAATSATLMEGHAQKILLSKSFIADEPFLFMVRNNDTKEFYWIGRVYRP